MPRANVARLAVIHPASTSRIERAATELCGVENIDVDEKSLTEFGKRYGIRKAIKFLEALKEEYNARMVLMIKREGEADPKGKIRYYTDAHQFQIVNGRNIHTDVEMIKKNAASMGLTPKQTDKLLKNAVSVTEYEYAGIYPAKAKDDETKGGRDKAGDHGHRRSR